MSTQPPGTLRDTPPQMPSQTNVYRPPPPSVYQPPPPSVYQPPLPGVYRPPPPRMLRLFQNKPLVVSMIVAMVFIIIIVIVVILSNKPSKFMSTLGLSEYEIKPYYQHALIGSELKWNNDDLTADEYYDDRTFARNNTTANSNNKARFSLKLPGTSTSYRKFTEKSSH